MKWSKMTHVGRVRSVNEDFVCARPDLGFFAVADGMGGHRAGEVASKKAIEYVEEAMEKNPCREKEPGAILEAAIAEANQLIYDLGYYNSDYRGMGTTITACFFTGMVLTVAHVGDSRCYLIRDSKVDRLTRDHSLVEEMIQQEQITPVEAMHHPYRNVLTRALGISPRVDVDIVQCTLSSNDIILLCTDGVTEHLTDEELAGMVLNNEPEGAVRAIVNEALNRGGNDNITLIVVAVE